MVRRTKAKQIRELDRLFKKKYGKGLTTLEKRKLKRIKGRLF